MEIQFYGRLKGEREAQYMEQCLGSELETDGLFQKRLLSLAERWFPDSHLLFTTSCSSALETAVASLRLKSGDEVILPSFNFPSAANSVLLQGGIPVLCDIDPDTQNLSVSDVARLITPRTRGVMPVDYAGVAYDAAGLKKLASEAGITVIEDAA